MHKFIVFVGLLIIFIASAGAKGVYQTNEAFINEVFKGQKVKPKALWLTGAVKQGAIRILGAKPTQLRVRYWRDKQKTAWILHQTGKEKPITVGLVINDNQLERIKVLAFRESRGWEVKEAFFLQQFYQAQLQDLLTLNKPIDGISGATLSVRALKKVARLALFYHQQVMKKDGI